MVYVNCLQHLGIFSEVMSDVRETANSRASLIFQKRFLDAEVGHS